MLSLLTFLHIPWSFSVIRFLHKLHGYLDMLLERFNVSQFGFLPYSIQILTVSVCYPCLLSGIKFSGMSFRQLVCTNKHNAVQFFDNAETTNDCFGDIGFSHGQFPNVLCCSVSFDSDN